jgi:hypothetical protein
MKFYIAFYALKIINFLIQFKQFCERSLPDPTVDNVCEMLAMAHVHGADGLTARAAAFVRAHSAQVMQTAGWSELVKQPALVNHVFSAVTATPSSSY